MAFWHRAHSDKCSFKLHILKLTPVSMFRSKSGFWIVGQLTGTEKKNDHLHIYSLCYGFVVKISDSNHEHTLPSGGTNTQAIQAHHGRSPWRKPQLYILSPGYVLFFGSSSCVKGHRQTREAVQGVFWQKWNHNRRRDAPGYVFQLTQGRL
jgi:hypothetical protein